MARPHPALSTNPCAPSSELQCRASRFSAVNCSIAVVAWCYTRNPSTSPRGLPPLDVCFLSYHILPSYPCLTHLVPLHTGCTRASSPIRQFIADRTVFTIRSTLADTNDQSDNLLACRIRPGGLIITIPSHCRPFSQSLN